MHSFLYIHIQYTVYVHHIYLPSLELTATVTVRPWKQAFCSKFIKQKKHPSNEVNLLLGRLVIFMYTYMTQMLRTSLTLLDWSSPAKFRPDSVTVLLRVKDADGFFWLPYNMVGWLRYDHIGGWSSRIAWNHGELTSFVSFFSVISGFLVGGNYPTRNCF